MGQPHLHLRVGFALLVWKRPCCAVVLGTLLCSGDQLGRSNAEGSRELCDGGKGWPALGTLDPAYVVAMHGAVEAKALLRDVEFVS